MKLWQQNDKNEKNNDNKHTHTHLSFTIVTRLQNMKRHASKWTVCTVWPTFSRPADKIYMKSERVATAWHTLVQPITSRRSPPWAKNKEMFKSSKIETVRVLPSGAKLSAVFSHFFAGGKIKLSGKKSQNKHWRFYLPLLTSKCLSIQLLVSRRLLGGCKYFMRHYL